MRIDLLFFGDRASDVAAIAFLTIASTLFVHCNLMRRPWFLTFVAIAAAAHLALAMMFPGADLDPAQFRLFALSDVLALIGLVFCVEKLLSLRNSTRPNDLRSPDTRSSLALARPHANDRDNYNPAMIRPRMARG